MIEQEIGNVDKSNELYGLVLAGGKSTRMGRDKGLIDYHGKPQRYHLADLLRRYCSKVYISCREEQASSIDRGYNLLVDSGNNNEQFDAIVQVLSDFSSSGKAWLVVACDLPFVDSDSLSYLIDNRDDTKIATVFTGSEGLPEPMIAIWEPSALEILTELRKKNITCPRKALLMSNEMVRFVKQPKTYTTMNVNTPEDLEKARRIIGDSKDK